MRIKMRIKIQPFTIDGGGSVDTLTDLDRGYTPYPRPLGGGGEKFRDGLRLPFSKGIEQWGSRGKPLLIGACFAALIRGSRAQPWQASL